MFNSIMIISMSDGKLKDNYLCGMSSLIYIKPATMPISIFPKGLGEPIDKKLRIWKRLI